MHVLLYNLTALLCPQIPFKHIMTATNLIGTFRAFLTPLTTFLTYVLNRNMLIDVLITANWYVYYLSLICLPQPLSLACFTPTDHFRHHQSRLMRPHIPFIRLHNSKSLSLWLYLDIRALSNNPAHLIASFQPSQTVIMSLWGVKRTITIIFIPQQHEMIVL